MRREHEWSARPDSDGSVSVETFEAYRETVDAERWILRIETFAPEPCA